MNSNLDKVKLSLIKRKREEALFRFYGLVGIISAILFLIIILYSVISQGQKAFFTTFIKVDVYFDAEIIDPENKRNSEDIQFADFGTIISESLKRKFPYISDKSDIRELASFISTSEADNLAEFIVKNKNYIGESKIMWLLASSTIDVIVKNPEMEKLIETHNQSSILVDGARVVITGAPNVGKSTLLNSLLGEERAIVTDVPGTTRDTVDALTYFSNYPVLLLDTAGIRKTKNKIENIGIEKTKQEIMSADIIYNIQSNKKNKNQKTDPKKTINIYNKSDLMTKREKLELKKENPNCVIISAKDKVGITALKSKTEKFLKLKTESTASLFLSSKRQQTALINSVKHLKEALTKESLYEIEVIAHNLRIALNEFDLVLGRTTTDDILESVFSNFCVGK